MNALINTLRRCGLLKKDLDYHLVRASMVIIFLFFGYQKWFAYEAQALIPFIVLSTVTIIPFMPNVWAASAGGFPAMTEVGAFLMKDLVLLAVSVYLLKQDVERVTFSSGQRWLSSSAA